MPFGRLVCGAKRKASDNDKKSEVKKVKMAELGDSKATNGTCEMRDVENVEDWGREADMEMQKKKLTVNLPNTRSRLPRLRRQLREDTPLEVKPALKRKERLTQQKGKAETRKDVKTDAMKDGKANITKDIKMEATKVVKVESTKDGKAETTKDRRARDPKAERNVRRGGKRAETTEDDEPKEERIKEDAVKGGGGTMAEEEREENPRKREKGKEKATKAKATHRLKTALGVREKPLKVKDRAVAKTEDVPLAVVPVPLPAAASMKEPDIVSAEPNCQELPCQVQQVTVPVVPHATRQLQIMQREQTMDLDNDDNGCLSLHMLSHSMQRGSKEDQLYCLQYANDIMAYLKSLEAKYVIPADFSAPVHPQTKSCMRATLVDWLVQVQEHQGLLEESLHLCIAMLDVYLSRCRVTFSQYQLVGVTCLFIASKYEERFPPTIKSLINLTDNSYIYDEVIAMERHVLKGLDYQLSIPTPLVFLHWFLWRLDCKEADRELLEMMCIYILSLTLLRSTFPKFSASLKSAAVILISRELLASHGAAFPADASKQLKVRAGVSANPWDVKCVQVTGYELQDLKACSALMVKELKMAKTMKFQGPQEKFNQPQYLSVSSHPALAAVALNELTEMLDRLPEG